MPSKLLHQMRAAKGLTRALNDSGRFKYKNPECVVDFAVIGGGVVGLAVAQRTPVRGKKQGGPRRCIPSDEQNLYERFSSSRNSEVVHSGLYYPPESLKTSLCLRGRDLLYERCEKYHIPFKQTGKLVVATEDQRSYVEELHAKSLKLKWPPHSPKSSQTAPVLLTKLLSKREIRELEPDLSENIVAALWSPKTGIIDSHSLMESLEKDILDSEGGELVFATDAVRVDRYQKSRSAEGAPDIETNEEGWVVQAISQGEGGYAILARHLINASGLSSVMFLNSFLPRENRIPMFYARGSYASYHGPGVSNVSHLIYPCPQTGPNAHAFESLGTHLTLDLQGKIRFGPDIEWIDPPKSNITGTEKDAEFWTRNLIPDDSRLPDIYQAVTSYLPGVALEGLQPDYVGIRPKLIPPGGGFQDFVIRADYPSVDAQRNHSNAMISLLGIESPGLTSSLAIAEMVVEDVLHNT